MCVPNQGIIMDCTETKIITGGIKHFFETFVVIHMITKQYDLRYKQESMVSKEEVHTGAVVKHLILFAYTKCFYSFVVGCHNKIIPCHHHSSSIPPLLHSNLVKEEEEESLINR